MTNVEELKNTFINIIQKESAEKNEIAQINQAINSGDKISFQIADNIINISKSHGIKINNRNYPSWNEETLRALIVMIEYDRSIERKITEKGYYYRDEIDKVIYQTEQKLRELRINYERELRSLETDYKNSLITIENAHQNSRSQEIVRIISELRQKKSSLESYEKSLEQQFSNATRGGGSPILGELSQELASCRRNLWEIMNEIEAFSQSGASLPSHGPAIPNVDQFFENQKAQRRKDYDIAQRRLESNFLQNQTEIKSKADAEIQRIEKNGREQIYRFIIQFYLCKEGYPFSPDSFKELEQFQRKLKSELKMSWAEINTIEKSEIGPFYEKNRLKYKEEFTQLIHKQGYPLSDETIAHLKQRQKSLGLKHKDVVSTEEPIIEPFYKKNLKQYEEEFTQIIKEEGYPLSDETIAHLKQRQKSLGLEDGDVVCTEEPIIQPFYKKNLEQYKEELIELRNEKVNALTKESLAQLRNKKDILGLKSEDVKAIEEQIIKQFYQISLDKYEQEFIQIINQEGYTLNDEVMTTLKQRQELLGIQLLGFNSEDIVTVKQIIKNSQDKNRAINYLSSNLFKENYQKLRNLLDSNNWQEANEETKLILLELTKNTKLELDQKELEKITEEQIRMIDILQIKIIDILWDLYSEGRFSFNKQRDIFITADRNYKTFSENIGWKKKVFFLFDFLSWKSKDKIMFTIDAPEGHLPFWRLYIVDPEKFLINLIDLDF